MTILDQIIEKKKVEVSEAKSLRDIASIKQAASSCRRPLPFTTRLRNSSFPAIIAEIKKASPSKGEICPQLDPVTTAEAYLKGGAACISILTDQHFFKGSLDHLIQVRAKLDQTPLLRKEFIIDQYQIWESYLAGADCILLIVAALAQEKLTDLLHLSLELGLSVLIEAHSYDEVILALEVYQALPQTLDRSLVAFGINNRNLHTFHTTVDLGIGILTKLSKELSPSFFSNLIFVSESGIFTENHILSLSKAGAQAFLIGESLLKQGEPGENLARLRDKAQQLR